VCNERRSSESNCSLKITDAEQDGIYMAWSSVSSNAQCKLVCIWTEESRKMEGTPSCFGSALKIPWTRPTLG